MIYLIFTISLLAFLLLKSAQVYYEYFSITTSPRNYKDNRNHRKSNFPRTPKIIFWIFFKSSRPNWIIKGNKSIERKLSIVKSYAHFISILCIVTFVFSLLQLWLDTTTQIDTAKATFFKIEETQFRIKDFAGHFKFAFVYDVLFLFLLITLEGSFPVLEQYKVKEKIKKYNKAVKSVLYFLTISTSFTFFGNRFASNEEARVGQLEIHKLQILENNKLLFKQINDAVTDKIVNEIIANPQIEEVLDKIEEIKKSIEDSKYDDDYKKFTAVAPPNFVRNLSIGKFESNFNSKFNFENDFNKSESKFQNDYQQNSASESDYYKTKEKSNYSTFKKKNKQWYNEKSFTKSSAKKAEETFTSASKNVSSKYAKYYSKYKEPIEKIIKNVYDNTGGKLVKSFFEAIGVDFVFFEELIDPIINDPAKDLINKEVEKLYKYCTESNSEAIKTELKDFTENYKTYFDTKVNSSEKLAKLNEQLSAELISSKKVLLQTKSQIASHLNDAEKYFQQLKATDEWETIRTTFYRQLRNGEFTLLPSDMEAIFQSAFQEWNDYLKENKFKLYFQNEKYLEPMFIEYTKQNSKLTAAWGYVVLSKRENEIADMFPYSNHLRPYEALQYYYSKNGISGESFDKIYSNDVNEVVGQLCPNR